MNPGQEPSQLPLRDIHLPDPVSWWPPAPGWWLLLLLLLASMVLVHWLIKRRREKKLSVAVQARQELQRIQAGFRQHQDKVLLAKELSELLRRVCISVFPREETASLTGQEWLAYLDNQVDSSHFVEGKGSVLVEAPYRNDVDYDPDVLIEIVEQWLVVVISKKGQST